MNCTLLSAVVVLTSVSVQAQKLPSGDATIRAPFRGSEIVITTTRRLAGAIHSLKWNGQEFINSTDHGRQLQSASNLDAGSKFTGETFNPTEAGSRFDGAGARSTSRLLHLFAEGNQLQTTSQMAFWLRPGEKSSGNPAKNKALLSNHLLTKRVTIGYDDMANVIQYNVTFGTPVGEHHTYAQFEAVTGYMPSVFSRFLAVDLNSGELLPLTDGPGEQRHPVILSTPSGSHAMGVYSADQPSPGYEHAGYGRFRFERQKVVKWNCVFRIRSREGVPPDDYSFQQFVVVGTRDDVRTSILRLHNKLKKDDGLRRE
ncbi:MAG TPA: hypothetical protein DCG12_08235 [Planctomycetaceae bacterium]|nr:hypothetical protein [Planctomycetaceae bacterium]